MHTNSFFFSIQMGMADVIVDLVSSGTTLRENNLKEIEGGVILESQVSSHTHALARKVPTVPFV
jgi:ATP phosphoribosyltransferase